MSTIWSRLLSAFVRPATPASDPDAVLRGAAEGGTWAPPVAPAGGEGATPSPRVHRDRGETAPRRPFARRAGRGRVAGAPPPPSVYAVLAAPAAARSLGAACALSLGQDAALLASWGAAGPRGGMSAPASRPARRLAASLAGRGFEVRAAGRLVEVRLPEDEDAAVDDLRRAEAAAAAAGAVSVVVLSAARGEAWDGVLATRDAVLLHGGDDAIIELARAQLDAIGASTHRLARAPSRLTLALARAGVVPWGASRPLRFALEASS